MTLRTGLWGNWLFLIAALGITLACSAISSTPNAQPTFDPTKAALEFQSTALAQQLTQAAPNTNVDPTLPPTTQVEVQATAPVPSPTEPQQRFFTEDFDADVTNWTTFQTGGNQEKLTQAVEDGFWVFDLDGKEMQVYSLYEPEVYDDVRIDVRAENRFESKHTVSIICRYDRDEGWFEFNLFSSGLYRISYGMWKASGIQSTYRLIADGSSGVTHQVFTTNDYSVICQGDTLALWINGKEVRSITQQLYTLTGGQVGVGVSSTDQLPVTVGIDSVQISEP